MDNKKVKDSDKQKNTIILIAVIVIVILMAKILYDNLSKNVGIDTLVPQNEINTDANSKSETTDKNTDSENSEADPNAGLQKAPNFTFTDYDGNEISLEEMINKPTIINFWATWCGFCKKEMPEFDEMYKKYGEDINFIMLDMTDGVRETTEKAKKFIDDNGYSFPVYYDTKREGAYTYGVNALPTTLFINADGYIVAIAQTALDKAILQKGIDMIYTEPEEKPLAVVAREQTHMPIKNPSWCDVEPEYIKLSVDEAVNFVSELEQGKDYYLIDVADVGTKSIDNAINVALDDIEDDIEDVISDKRSIVFVYCNDYCSEDDSYGCNNRHNRHNRDRHHKNHCYDDYDCGCSELAARQMVSMGYNHVYDIGGLDEAKRIFGR